MKISVIYPTRNRPSIAYLNFLSWQEKTSFDLPTEWILSIDDDDKSDYSWFPYTILASKNRSCVDAINNAAKICTGDVMLVMSDDFECPNGWNFLLSKELMGKTDFLLKTDDGIQPTLVTLPILDRKYYNRFKYIYNPLYFHMWVDTEMTAVAIMLGRYIKSDLKFFHNHYTTGKFSKDDISLRNDGSWGQGSDIFNQRLKTNFGLAPEQIVKRYEEIQWR